jgi:hypothetical protein
MPAVYFSTGSMWALPCGREAPSVQQAKIFLDMHYPVLVVTLLLQPAPLYGK